MFEICFVTPKTNFGYELDSSNIVLHCACACMSFAVNLILSSSRKNLKKSNLFETEVSNLILIVALNDNGMMLFTEEQTPAGL